MVRLKHTQAARPGWINGLVHFTKGYVEFRSATTMLASVLTILILTLVVALIEIMVKESSWTIITTFTIGIGLGIANLLFLVHRLQHADRHFSQFEKSVIEPLNGQGEDEID